MQFKHLLMMEMQFLKEKESRLKQGQIKKQKEEHVKGLF